MVNFGHITLWICCTTVILAWLHFFRLRSHVLLFAEFLLLTLELHPQEIFLSKIMWKGNVLSICMPERHILHYAFSNFSPPTSTLCFPPLPSNKNDLDMLVRGLLTTKHNGHEEKIRNTAIIKKSH